VRERQEEEPHDGEDGEGKVGREAVDDDGRVPFSVGVGEVGVDVASQRPAGYDCCQLGAMKLFAVVSHVHVVVNWFGGNVPAGPSALIPSIERPYCATSKVKSTM
jgi:hypothetical protein